MGETLRVNHQRGNAQVVTRVQNELLQTEWLTRREITDLQKVSNTTLRLITPPMAYPYRRR